MMFVIIYYSRATLRYSIGYVLNDVTHKWEEGKEWKYVLYKWNMAYVFGFERAGIARK